MIGSRTGDWAGRRGEGGKGKILICSIDLKTDIERRPAARQFLYSLEKYVSSKDLRRSGGKSPELHELFK